MSNNQKKKNVLHGSCLKLGLADGPTLGTRLMSFYEEFGCEESAGLVFDQMASRGAAAWTARLSRDSRDRRFLGVLDGFRDPARRGRRRTPRCSPSSSGLARGSATEGDRGGKFMGAPSNSESTEFAPTRRRSSATTATGTPTAPPSSTTAAADPSRASPPAPTSPTSSAS